VTEFEALLTDRLRVLGPDHPHTLMTRNNLARWQNRLDEQTPTPSVTSQQAPPTSISDQ
jgi:hypothetical protein